MRLRALGAPRLLRLPFHALIRYSPAHPIALKLRPSRARSGGCGRGLLLWVGREGGAARQQRCHQNQHTKLFNHDGLYSVLNNAAPWSKVKAVRNVSSPKCASDGARSLRWAGSRESEPGEKQIYQTHLGDCSLHRSPRGFRLF